MAGISKAQIKAIRGIAVNVFTVKGAYHDWLHFTFFKDDPKPQRSSTTQLSKAEGHIAITLLLEAGGNSAKPAAKKKRSPRYLGSGSLGALTQTQANTIALYESKLGWAQNPKRLAGFIERQIGEPKKVSWLKNREASTVITGLKKIHEEG